jgi:hypothetical protein
MLLSARICAQAMQFLNQQLPQNKRRGWPDMMPEEEQGSFGSHEFSCEVRNLLTPSCMFVLWLHALGDAMPCWAGSRARWAIGFRVHSYVPERLLR